MSLSTLGIVKILHFSQTALVISLGLIFISVIIDEIQHLFTYLLVAEIFLLWSA